jgi:hypothetical protein
VNTPAQRRTLPVILIAAVAHGLLFYWLHLSIRHETWPATHGGWLVALYAISIFVPLTVQMLAEHYRSRMLWTCAGALAVAYFYFGWHYGARILDEPATRLFSSGRFFSIGLVLGILWLLMLPFVQWRLSSGHWRAPYTALFSSAWRNKVTLAEAALFTGLLWALLLLWQELFNMLGIRFFRELFEQPLFAYPVTAITFGIALHLIGSVERLTSVVLEQLLNVLKWLAVIAALILALFTVALVSKLPETFLSQQRVIGAAWLLWLVAVMVLLLNAAFRDGSTGTPYPRWIAFGLRLVTPLSVIVSLAALSALFIRIGTYGATVDRVWGIIVALCALAYSVGYSWAAWWRGSEGAWMHGMARVNIVVALALVATLALTLTPVLSPYRIAAKSQYRRALESPTTAQMTASGRRTPLAYLRFDAGKYGTERLEALASIQDHERASEIRAAAQIALKWTRDVGPPQIQDAKAWLDDLQVFPAGRSVDDELRSHLDTSVRVPAHEIEGHQPVGLFVDLNDDDIDEFVVFLGPRAHAFELTAEQRWRQIGILYPSGGRLSIDLKEQLEQGNVETEPRQWRDLILGEQRFRLNEPIAP